MTVVGVSVVKNEIDIIQETVRNMSDHVDFIVVADNMSDDGTREALEELATEIEMEIIDDREPAHLHGDKITNLAHFAGSKGADWIVPFDADEWWYATEGPIKSLLEEVDDNYMSVEAKLFDHISTGFDDQSISNPIDRINYRRRYPLPMPKVACRYRKNLNIWMGNHQCDYDGEALDILNDCLVVRHFAYRSPEHFLAKIRKGVASLDAAGDLLRSDICLHWRQWGGILDAQGEDAIYDIYKRWYYKEDPNRIDFVEGEVIGNLVYDPAPRV